MFVFQILGGLLAGVAVGSAIKGFLGSGSILIGKDVVKDHINSEHDTYHGKFTNINVNNEEKFWK